MTDIPHLAYPFTLNASGHAVVCEQDSIDDIENCLTTILITDLGTRLELPDFGIENPLFKLQPLDIAQIENDLLAQEPRATTLLSQQPSPLDYLTALITVDVTSAHLQIGES